MHSTIRYFPSNITLCSYRVISKLQSNRINRIRQPYRKMYFQCCKSTHSPILLPDGVPILVGRSPETKITDKLCSRKQLELVANYSKKHVMVKQLGKNPSQIEGIDIGHRKASILVTDRTLHVIEMKYPHKIAITWPNTTRPTSEHTSKLKFNLHETLENPNEPKRRKLSDKNSQKKVVAETCSPENGRNSSNESGTDESNRERTKIKKRHWSQGLKASVSDPSLQVYSDATVIAIKDKYPKAKYHWLVMPVDAITTTSQLRTSHIELLKHMLKIGQQLVDEQVLERDKGALKFRYGYHAVPSMSHLHMHVISQDFCSPSLKTKKHWNSFTTAYFVDAEVIINEVEKDGRVKNRKEMSNLLATQLCCHVCKKTQRNMPELKKHIAVCR